MLKLSDVSYEYKDTSLRILDTVNISFKKGIFYTILGESGSGKTTFLSLIAGLDIPSGGSIYFNNDLVDKNRLDRYRRNCVSIIFQSYNLIPYMTPIQNIRLAMSITENDTPDNQITVSYNLLKYLGINSDIANRQVAKLSGGEQQRVAIARALSTNVDILLADEPTGNLNEEKEKEIINIFQDLAHKHNKCVIVVTHSPVVAKESDQIYRLKNKKIISEDVI